MRCLTLVRTITTNVFIISIVIALLIIQRMTCNDSIIAPKTSDMQNSDRR